MDKHINKRLARKMRPNKKRRSDMFYQYAYQARNNAGGDHDGKPFGFKLGRVRISDYANHRQQTNDA